MDRATMAVFSGNANPQLAQEIEAKIKAKLGVGAVEPGEESQAVPEVDEVAQAIAKEDAPF